MDLKQLGHFAAVTEHGSFRKAADALCISQPALSISIKKLESSLNCRLLDRAPGKIVPTAYGRSLYESIRSIQKEMRLAQFRLNEIHDIAKGEVSIGVSPYAFTKEFGRLLSGFVNRYPGLDLRVSIETYESALPSLHNERIEFIVAEVSDREHLPQIGYRTLYRHPYVVIARPGHSLTNQNTLQASDLAAHRWACGTNMVDHVNNWKETFANAGLAPPVPEVAGGTMEFYEELLRSTDFLAALPMALARSRIETGHLARLEIPGIDWFNYMVLVYREDLTMPPGARRLFDAIINDAEDGNATPPAAPA